MPSADQKAFQTACEESQPTTLMLRHFVRCELVFTSRDSMHAPLNSELSRRQQARAQCSAHLFLRTFCAGDPCHMTPCSSRAELITCVRPCATVRISAPRLLRLPAGLRAAQLKLRYSTAVLGHLRWPCLQPTTAQECMA